MIRFESKEHTTGSDIVYRGGGGQSVSAKPFSGSHGSFNLEGGGFLIFYIFFIFIFFLYQLFYIRIIIKK